MGAEKPKTLASQVQAPKRVVVNSSGQLLAPANPLRNSISIENEDATSAICIGYTSGVTYSGTSTPGANDGGLIPPDGALSFENYAGAVYAAWDGTHPVTVSVIEE